MTTSPAAVDNELVFKPDECEVPEALARRDRRITHGLTVAGVLIAGVLLYAIVVPLGTPRESRFDDSLRNPMGGPARTAPGDATGEIVLGGLEVAGADVAMGDVALGVTYVPGWEITNPTDTAVTFLVGQPQVLEGCCPGPVYADGQLTQAGQEFTVPPGDHRDRCVRLLAAPAPALRAHPVAAATRLGTRVWTTSTDATAPA